MDFAQKGRIDMYKEKDRSYFLIAVIYWVMFMAALLLMSVLSTKGIKNDFIQWGFTAITILFVAVKDKNLTNVGFTTEKLKTNLIISCSVIVVSFLVGVAFGKYSLSTLFKRSLRQLFYTAVQEEIICRGFLQNYLMGLKRGKYVSFLIGGVMFSLAHLPYKMFMHNDFSLSYVLGDLPHLTFCFVFHLAASFITYKRKDITIPIAIHYALNYVTKAL